MHRKERKQGRRSLATLIEHFLGLILIDLPVCLQRISLIFFHIFRQDLKVQGSDDEDDDHRRSPVMPNENEQTHCVEKNVDARK